MNLECIFCGDRSSNVCSFRDVHFYDIPHSWMNEYERAIMRDFIMKSQSLNTVGELQVLLNGRIDSGEQRVKIPGSIVEMTDSSSSVCKDCAIEAINEALYQYRIDISDSIDIPERIRNRTKCWYGRECRTQFTNPVHAQKLDHVCPNTTRASNQTRKASVKVKCEEEEEEPVMMSQSGEGLNRSTTKAHSPTALFDQEEVFAEIYARPKVKDEVTTNPSNPVKVVAKEKNSIQKLVEYLQTDKSLIEDSAHFEPFCSQVLKDLKARVNQFEKEKAETYERRKMKQSSSSREEYYRTKYNFSFQIHDFTSMNLRDPLIDSDNSISFSPEQQLAIDMAVSGKSFFFTGSAGTGKSFVLREIIRRLRAQMTASYGDSDITLMRLAVTASTGIAAVNIGGRTVHSLLGVGYDNTFRFAWGKKDELRNLQVLIIDEISMIDAHFFDCISKVLIYLRHYNEIEPELNEYLNNERVPDKIQEIPEYILNRYHPFGGVQIILCGDFCQLPPVFRKHNQEQMERKKKFPLLGEMAFKSNEWKRAIGDNVVLLNKIFRQKDDEVEFVQLLNKLRMGEVDMQIKQQIKALTRELSFSDNIKPTRLYSTNSNVDSENQMELEALKTDLVVYSSRFNIDYLPSHVSYSESSIICNELEKNAKAATVPQEFHVKVGAQVILVKNLTRTLVNGSRGIVEEFVHIPEYVYKWEEKESKAKRLFASWLADHNFMLPVVKFTNGERVVINPDFFEITGPKGSQGTLFQIPLKLAWALTIHKCQGMTIDRAVVSLSNIFEASQIYVALSRVRSISGLQIRDFNPWGLDLKNEEAIQFYKKRASNVFLSDSNNNGNNNNDQVRDVPESSPLKRKESSTYNEDGMYDQTPSPMKRTRYEGLSLPGRRLQFSDYNIKEEEETE